MTRDMTEAQFNAALERNGFRRVGGGWVEHKDFPKHMLGLTYSAGFKKLMRRTSLANVLKRLDQIRAEEARKSASAS